MQLIEYIKKLNTKILFKYLLEGEDKVHFSEALYESLEKKVLSPTFIEEKLDSFDEEEMSTLFSIYLSGEQGVVFESASVRAPLLRSFMVYEKSSSDDIQLAPFVEYNDSIAKVVYEEAKAENRPAAYVLPFKDVFKTDIALLFGLLVKKSDVLKQTGLVTKQFQEMFLSVTHIGGLLHSLALSPREQELFMDFLLSTLEKCSYIQKEYNLLKVSSMVEEDFTELLTTMRSKIISVVEKGGINRAFVHALVKHGPVTLDKQYFSTVSLMALLLLSWLGEYSIAIDGQNITIDKANVSDLEAYYPSGHMMPDFSVMIPREIDPVSLFEYMKIGTVDSLDMIYKGTVSRDIIVDSIAGTFQESSVEKVMNKWNGAPNLFSTVKEWIHGFNKLYIDGAYLAVKGADAEAVTSLPEIEPLVSEVEGYRFFRIQSGKEALLESILKSKNFDTRFPDSTEPSHLFSKSQFVSIDEECQINFDPEMEASSAPKSQGGIYSSQLKALSVGDMSKLVKYATLMDYKLTIDYKNEFDELSNHIITPINLAGGKESFIEASDESGNVKKFWLEKIDKIGVLSDDC